MTVDMRQGAASAAPGVLGTFNPETAFSACVQGLRSFMDDTFGKREHDVVVGLSGGIDSALVAVIAKEAFGAEHVHAVTMPGPYTTAGTHDDAGELAAHLGICLDDVAIEGAYEAMLAAIGDGTGTDVRGTIAGQNIQARLRMIMLMALSNAHGWTVLNSGNLSEACMGYCTLYGDTVGAYGPIGGLLKTEVYAVANWINAASQATGAGEVIPASIITRPPSAELAAGQTDEDSLGITYAELDALLSRILAGEDEDAIAAESAQAAEVLRRMHANAFKQRWLPPHTPVLHG